MRFWLEKKSKWIFLLQMRSWMLLTWTTHSSKCSLTMWIWTRILLNLKPDRLRINSTLKFPCKKIRKERLRIITLNNLERKSIFTIRSLTDLKRHTDLAEKCLIDNRHWTLISLTVSVSTLDILSKIQWLYSTAFSSVFSTTMNPSLSFWERLFTRFTITKRLTSFLNTLMSMVSRESELKVSRSSSLSTIWSYTRHSMMTLG